MYSSLRWWLLAIILTPLVVVTAQDPTLTPSPTPFPPSGEGGQFALLELFQLRFDLPQEYTNPYNPDEVSVTAIFNAPNGEVYETPAFYMQDFVEIGQEVEPLGNPDWRVRFTPTQVGDWQYSLEVRTPESREVTINGEFTVTPSPERGFIRVSPNQRYFTFQNGEPYFPIGENLGWSWEEGGGLKTYLSWLDELAAQGANYARIVVDTAWFIGLDWQSPAGDYTDEQRSAWMMDQILLAAEARGIYLQVVLIWHQAFIQTVGSPVIPPETPARPNTEVDFDSHAYNQANGGVLSSPENFFANRLVGDLLRQKLRYMVARWGYSPHIFAWELLTDVDRLPNYNPDEHLTFINDLADYLRSLDPYPHLVTVGSRDPRPELLNNERFDFAQVRVYQSRPIEESVEQVGYVLNTLYNPVYALNKPLLITEFSLNPWFEPTADDPLGIHLHNTLWTAAFAGTAGGAMTQWWDTYVDPQNLYPYFYPLSEFVAGINWGTLNLQPAQVGLLSAREDEYQPLRIDGFNRAFRSASQPNTVYTITADGVFPSISLMSSYLYGTGFNAAASLPQSFLITPPKDTTLSIGIRDIAPNGRATLVIYLDNALYATLDLTEGSQNTQLNIPLPAGSHRMVIDNTGQDWVELDYIEIEDYITPLRALALTDTSEGVALVWLQNRDYRWENIAQGIEGAALRFTLTIPNLPIGVYQVEYWDTVTGNRLGQELATIAGEGMGDLNLTLVPIRAQLAVKAIRLDRPEAVVLAPTLLPTRTPLVQPTLTPTATETPSPTFTPTATLTLTASPTPTLTASPSPTTEATLTASPSETLTPSPTQTASITEEPSEVSTEADIEETETATDTPSVTIPATLTSTVELSPTVTPTSAEGLIPRLTRTPRPIP